MKLAHRKTHRLIWTLLFPALLLILLFFGRATDSVLPLEHIPGLDDNPDNLNHRILP